MRKTIYSVVLSVIIVGGVALLGFPFAEAFPKTSPKDLETTLQNCPERPSMPCPLCPEPEEKIVYRDKIVQVPTQCPKPKAKVKTKTVYRNYTVHCPRLYPEVVCRSYCAKNYTQPRYSLETSCPDTRSYENRIRNLEAEIRKLRRQQ